MKTLTTLMGLLFCLAASPASADAFVKFHGIVGDSASDKDHKGWSVIYGFTQKIQAPGGSDGASRRRGGVVLEDVLLSKPVDKASIEIARAAVKGKSIPIVKIQLTKNGTVHFAYDLEHVTVTGYEVTESGDGRPMEKISLSYKKIKMIYTEVDRNGKIKGKNEVSANK